MIDISDKKETGCSRKVITLRLGRSEEGAVPSTPIASFTTGTLDTKLKSFYNNKVNKSKRCL